MGNSGLVSYTKISPYKCLVRNHAIDTITIHCVVGQASVEGLGSVFNDPKRRVSANYGIGFDGRIGLYVEEKHGSWCSSSENNDKRAITIECASNTTHPYAVNDKVMASLIKLCADIAKRNGMGGLRWKGDKSLIGNVALQNMTVHRWFANKSCPGDYLYNLHGQIAAHANSLNAPAPAPALAYRVKVTATVLNIRKGPGTNYAKNGEIKDQGVYTVVGESSGQGATKWGKLKSGAGWISLDFVKRI